MLVIRLQRVGRKNDPSFRVVVNDKRRSAKAGSAVEFLGSYNPRQKTVNLKEERVKYWLSVGAKPSDTAHNLFVSKKIISSEKIDVSKKSKKEEKTSANAGVEEKPAAV